MGASVCRCFRRGRCCSNSSHQVAVDSPFKVYDGGEWELRGAVATESLAEFHRLGGHCKVIHEGEDWCLADPRCGLGASALLILPTCSSLVQTISQGWCSLWLFPPPVYATLMLLILLRLSGWNRCYNLEWGLLLMMEHCTSPAFPAPACGALSHRHWSGLITAPPDHPYSPLALWGDVWPHLCALYTLVP